MHRIEGKKLVVHLGKHDIAQATVFPPDTGDNTSPVVTIPWAATPC